MPDAALPMANLSERPGMPLVSQIRQSNPCQGGGDVCRNRNDLAGAALCQYEGHKDKGVP
jgi:hypothetical protein